MVPQRTEFLLRAQQHRNIQVTLRTRYRRKKPVFTNIHPTTPPSDSTPTHTPLDVRRTTLKRHKAELVGPESKSTATETRPD